MLVLLLLIAAPVKAQVTMHKMFSNHMVLQRGVEIPVYGYADSDDEIAVTFNSFVKKATVVDGRWKVIFPSMNAGGPYELRIQDGNGNEILILDDILIGDVWVCNGQSNMNFPLSKTSTFEDDKSLFTNDNIRLFKVDRNIASSPKEDLDGGNSGWKVSETSTAGSFSAVAWYFANKLVAELAIPIGLVHASWGGTNAEKWIASDAVHGELNYVNEDYNTFVEGYPTRRAALDAELNQWEIENANNAGALVPASLKEPKISSGSGEADDFSRPACLYNAMIHPLSASPIKGVLWYQGEGNSSNQLNAALYKNLFSGLITSWREAWGIPDFPFYYVQLPGFRSPSELPNTTDVWPVTRKSQYDVLALENTGMAVAIDLGEVDDIHPVNKKPVGQRLALQALEKSYHTGVLSDGPRFESVTFDETSVTVTFSNIGTGLVAKDVLLDTYQLSATQLSGFAICGSDGNYVWAEAKIEGDKVVVSSPTILNPAGVSYGWGDFPLCNLYNREGLPTAPFIKQDPTKIVVPLDTTFGPYTSDCTIEFDIAPTSTWHSIKIVPKTGGNAYSTRLILQGNKTIKIYDSESVSSFVYKTDGTKYNVRMSMFFDGLETPLVSVEIKEASESNWELVFDKEPQANILSVGMIQIEGSNTPALNLSNINTYTGILSTRKSKVSQDFRVVPNPVKSTLNIDTSLKINAVEIFAVTGQLLQRKSSYEAVIHSVNVEGLPSGIYILKMNSASGILTTRFIKSETL